MPASSAESAGGGGHEGGGGPRTRAENERRILVLAPTSNDARLTARFLEKAGLETTVCADIPQLCAELDAGCGAILLAEEAVANASVTLLLAKLEDQPSWSDLPVVMVTGPGDASTQRRRLISLGPMGNVSIIERPVRPDTLVSTFEFAMRSRRRQYQVRALLEEREQMTANVQQQARIFDTTLSSIPDFTYTFDRSGRFAYANQSMLDHLGLKLGDIVGRNFFELPYPPELASRLQRQVQQVFHTGQVLRDEAPYTTPAGAMGYSEYIFSPVFADDGTVEAVAGSTRDTSERRHNEEALRNADRRKDEFLAMLAHELRNPLASVASAVAVLQGANDAESHDWATRVIARQSGQLSHLIDDLLDVSRITTGKIRLRKEIVDAARILDRARESARPLVTERQHELVSYYPPGEMWIEADPTRVEQIVLNLLTNAAKYTPTGGRIELSARSIGGELSISVHDNGMGIPPQRLPEMFELFAQGERSIARSEGGLGIGLTIVQKLTEMHGGRVEAHSAGPNLGSTFTIHLPSSVPSVESNGKRPAVSVADSFRALRVLIVDDNVDTAEGLERLLKRAGHQVALAHDGRQALERARAFSPDAIVLDIGLPGMDGFEVVRLLRAEPCGIGALIIAVTGYGQEEDRRRALDAGFDHHLVKPVDFSALTKFLADASLKKSPRPASSRSRSAVSTIAPASSTP